MAVGVPVAHGQNVAYRRRAARALGDACYLHVAEPPDREARAGATGIEHPPLGVPAPGQRRVRALDEAELGAGRQAGVQRLHHEPVRPGARDLARQEIELARIDDPEGPGVAPARGLLDPVAGRGGGAGHGHRGPLPPPPARHASRGGSRIVNIGGVAVLEGGEQRLLEVELALQRPHDLVVDLAVVAQPQQCSLSGSAVSRDVLAPARSLDSFVTALTCG